MKKLLLLCLIFAFFSFQTEDIKTTWIKNLKSDFSFYPKKNFKCKAWCYEFVEASKINVKKISADTIECFTNCNAATHSSLNFYIIKNEVKNVRIELNSIKSGLITYTCKSGFIEIDETLFKKNILKAQFDFKFNHPENPETVMFWEGKIRSKIEK